MHLLAHSNIRTTLVYLHMRQPADLNITSPIDLDLFRRLSAPRSWPDVPAGPGELALVSGLGPAPALTPAR